MRASRKLIYYDLRTELAGKNGIVGRADEMERLTRMLGRNMQRHAVVVGAPGRGKSAVVYGWMRQLARDARFDGYALLQLEAAHLATLEEPGSEEHISEALAQLPRAVVFIDDFGRELFKNPSLAARALRLYKPSLRSAKVHLVCTLTPQEHRYLVREFPSVLAMLETLTLKEQAADESARILARALPKLNQTRRVIVLDSSITEAVVYAERYPVLGGLPRAGITLLDDALSLSAGRGEKVLSRDSLSSALEAKTGVPKAQIGSNAKARIKELAWQLDSRIVEQAPATNKITKTLQRASLGLRNPDRPLGSFLMLGPSGVGKTETAKCVAELLFPGAGVFVRFDMSEFQQEHTVQRLIGAPAGYVGHDEGGALTNALKKNPYCLILLDELEKAHPKVFDIFLQVLDEGRLTSGQNETIDARNAVIMATSNAAVSEILEAHKQGRHLDSEEVKKEVVLPALSGTFRLEFINRFDELLVYRPLSKPALMQIAHLEMKKVEKRLAHHKVRFSLEPQVLARRVSALADTRFGARPVKRFIEETCENLLAESLLSNV